MRNWRYVWLILPLMLVAAGCAGAPEMPGPKAPWTSRCRNTSRQQTNLTPEQKIHRGPAS